LSWRASIVAAEECRAQRAKLQISGSKHVNGQCMAFTELDQEFHYQLVHASDSNIADSPLAAAVRLMIGRMTELVCFSEGGSEMVYADGGPRYHATAMCFAPRGSSMCSTCRGVFTLGG
jgi:hypothetical protein